MLVTNIKMFWSGKLTFCKIAFLILHVALVTCIESKLVRQDILVTEDTIACSLNCERNGSDTDVCNHATGECMLGCKAGFAGPNCTLQCSDKDKYCTLCSIGPNSSGFVCTQCNRNFYRDNGKCLQCNYYCTINVSSPLAICRESDGYCQHGCRSNRFGFKCGIRCSSTCKDICHRDTEMVH
ncbi:protein draper-like [Mercenaria mercenaria]|uniref:protein draper-like n=1 Tax=Mercenaria mercenaria TaxID=6596 RepID=UPI00234F2F01|nr:protein draper-like [Mercenaria mercenaria]